MSWPKLSETLPAAVNMGTCQRCADTKNLIARWREHDETDRPSNAVIILCKPCSDAIIEPHPRLYSKMDGFEPWPGTMPICVGCKHHDGAIKCRSPKLLENGGTGLKMTYPTPSTGFIDRRNPKTGKREGGRFINYRGPVTECEGKEV